MSEELITVSAIEDVLSDYKQGKMVILMRDCQTTGGYPRILQLSEDSINLLAQKMQHETVSFKLKI